MKLYWATSTPTLAAMGLATGLRYLFSVEETFRALAGLHGDPVRRRGMVFILLFFVRAPEAPLPLWKVHISAVLSILTEGQTSIRVKLTIKGQEQQGVISQASPLSSAQS